MTTPADDRITRPDQAQRLELRYCPRCGVLGVAPAGQSGRFCGACLRALCWIHGLRPQRRDPRRIP